MTYFLRLLKERMKDPQRNKNFSKAVQIDEGLVEKNREGYNQAKENYYLYLEQKTKAK